MQIKGLPGYRVNDYIIVLPLPDDLKEEVQCIKKNFAEAYQAKQALTQPLIILSAFQGLALSEERIDSRLSAITRSLAPAKIELRDFGSFPTHSIYIHITSKVAVAGIVRELKKMQALMKPDKDHKPYFIDEAHLAICKKLRPWQYEKAWLEYSHHDFTGRFIAGSLQLLRKEESRDHFETVGTYAFVGEEEKMSQGDLFN